MVINIVKLAVSLAFAVLFLNGCASKNTASNLPELKGELQPINTNEKYKMMIEKQHSSVVDESIENAAE